MEEQGERMAKRKGLGRTPFSGMLVDGGRMDTLKHPSLKPSPSITLPGKYILELQKLTWVIVIH